MIHDDYISGTIGVWEENPTTGIFQAPVMGWAYDPTTSTRNKKEIDILTREEAPSGEVVYFLESNKDFEWFGNNQIYLAKYQRNESDNDLPF